MKTLNEYLKEEKNTTLPNFEDVKESIFDDPDELFDKFKDTYKVVKLLMDNGVISIYSQGHRNEFAKDPDAFLTKLLNNKAVVAKKIGQNYIIDLDLTVTEGKDRYISDLIEINSSNKDLPIEIGKVITKSGNFCIRFTGLKDLPVKWLPVEFITTSPTCFLSICVNNKRYSLDLSNRKEALSKFSSSCYMEINNSTGTVTADKIIWNNNPIPGDLSISTKFDNKTELSLPKVEGDLAIGKTGMKYYMEKLNLLNDPQLIKKAFGSNCEIKRLCE